MIKNSMTDIAHLYIKNIIKDDDIVIDATAGHGYDTIFLANLAKFVYAFDIQDDAILSTNQKIKELNLSNVKTIKDSYENYLNYVHDFNGALFNLGYLPKGDKTITTIGDKTLSTLKSMMLHIKKDGFIILVVYTGHEAGYLESELIHSYLETIDPKTYKIIKTYLPFQNNQPPYIIWITKT